MILFFVYNLYFSDVRESEQARPDRASQLQEQVRRGRAVCTEGTLDYCDYEVSF